MTNNETHTYRLGSSGLVFTPGIVAWGINGYHFPEDRENIRRVFTEGWSIPDEAVDALLSETVPHTVEDDVVSFTV